MNAAPWLPQTASTDRLNSDLISRGWQTFWRADGTVQLTSPNGDRLTVHGITTAATMRNAYASAQEHEGAQIGNAIRWGEPWTA